MVSFPCGSLPTRCSVAAAAAAAAAGATYAHTRKFLDTHMLAYACILPSVLSVQYRSLNNNIFKNYSPASLPRKLFKD